MMVVIGIDIGMRGALATVTHQAAQSVVDLPLLETEKDRRLHGLALHDLLRKTCGHHGSGAVFCKPGQAAEFTDRCLVVAENIRPRPGDRGGRSSTMHSEGSLMRSRGIVEAVCDVLALRVEWVEPQSWKRAYGLLGEEKEASRQTALALMPEMAHLLARKKDEGRAEALLIARYGMQRFG